MTWVHVGDRGSDIFRFLMTCRTQRCAFMVRAAKNRRVEVDGDEPPPDREEDEAATSDPIIDYLFPAVRSWASQGTRTIAIPAQHGTPARDAAVTISWGPVRLLSPRQEKADGPIDTWAVRVWEPEPPAGVKKPLEWILLTSVETTTAPAAWERVTWYSCRWTNADCHQCLKTGCELEDRHPWDQPALERLVRGQLFSRDSTGIALDIMLRQQLNQRLGRFLPRAAGLAHKRPEPSMRHATMPASSIFQMEVGSLSSPSVS